MRMLGTPLAICLGITAVFVPLEQTYATLQVSTLYAGGISWTQIFENLLGTMWYTIFVLSAAAFLVGALMYTAGFVSEENKSKGKNLMIGALVGMAVVLSAKAILNAAYFFVYNT